MSHLVVREDSQWLVFPGLLSLCASALSLFSRSGIGAGVAKYWREATACAAVGRDAAGCASLREAAPCKRLASLIEAQSEAAAIAASWLARVSLHMDSK